jgi:hypothetical protein
MVKRSTTPVVVVAAAVVAAAAVVDNDDGVQWRRWRGRLMAAAAFDGDGVRRGRRLTKARRWQGEDGV